MLTQWQTPLPDTAGTEAGLGSLGGWGELGQDAGRCDSAAQELTPVLGLVL